MRGVERLEILEDYQKYYSDKKVKPYFNAYNRMQDQVYYSVEESVDIAHQLLLFQCNDLESRRMCL